MKAFVEILAGIVRVGPECNGYGDPFEFAAAFSANAGVAIAKGLVGSDRYTLAHHRAGINALHAMGLVTDWERIKRKGA